MKTHIIIADLDGTLVAENTFTEFVKYCFRIFPALRVKLGGIVVMRKLRLISHKSAKRRIMDTVRPHIGKGHLKLFARYLMENERAFFAQDVMKRDGIKYLVTAAPAEYASLVGNLAGFDHTIATEEKGEECRGKEKVRRLENEGVKFTENVSVYTDHRDDIPLLGKNRRGRNYLISPSERSIQAIREAGIECEIIN